MRRLEVFSLVLACLLTLAACGGETPGGIVDPENPPPYPPFTGKNATFQCIDGLYIALPMEYSELLYLDSDFPDAGEGWKPLLSVYEKASYETAMEEYGGGGGFLFGFLVMDQAAFEQHISSDGSGIDVFATDGERYYAYTYPTDVQFCRPGGEIDTESEDWKTWETLCELGPLVREDFLTSNNLQSFSVQDFLGRLDESGDHVVLKYFPYFATEGEERVYDQLLLRQPARQGEGGIWAVDQWLDEQGNQSLYFPDSGMPAAEYYAQLQEKCDAGERPELLTPVGAAEAFVKDYFGHETAEGSFKQVPEVDEAYMEMNRRLQQLVLDLEFRPEEVDGLALLDCVGEATADNWGVLGRYMYGSDWFQPLMDAVAEAAVGEDQQARDRAVMAFLLSTRDTRTDFRTPLSGALQTQADADSAAFTAALAEFSEEDQACILESTGMESTGVGMPAR